MRKLFLVVLVGVLFALSLTAYAGNDISIETEYDGTGIWISGSTNISQGYPIAIIVGKTGVSLQDMEVLTTNDFVAAIEYIFVTEAPEDGIISKKYISLSESLATGECKVFVRTLGGDLTEVASFEHVSAEDINTLLSSFNEMDYSEYENIYTDKNKTTLSKLNAMTDVYDSLNYKSNFYSQLSKYRPFTEDTVNNTSAAYSLVNAFNKVCAFAELNEAADPLSVINKYNGKFWNVSTGDDSVYMSLSSEYREIIISDLQSKTPWDSETLEELFQKELAVAVFKSAKTRADIINAIESYNSFYSLDMSLLNDSRLNEYYVSEVYNKMLKSCGSCSSLEDISSLFDNSVKDVLSSVKPKTEKTSSGAGSSGVYKMASKENENINGQESDNTGSGNNSLYEDVPTTHWAYNYIDKLYKKGIVAGVADKTFAPDRPVKREEFVKILITAMGLEIGSDNSDISFEDVPAENYSYGYIKKAVEEKLIYGVDEKHFGFGQSIVREDAAVILSRILALRNNLPKGKFVSYNDANDISEYALESVINTTACQLFNGNSENCFCPKKSITRAETCAVIVRFMEYIDITEGLR